MATFGIVSIIIVNWNSGIQLSECIRSIEKFGKKNVMEVIVVDNDSSDNSEHVKSSSIPLTIINAGENLGFGRACNLASAKASGEYLLFLNPDARLMEGGLDNAVSFMYESAAAGVGACGIKLIDERGDVHRHCARLPSWKTLIAVGLGLDKIFPTKFRGLLMADFDHLESRDVEHVQGAFYLIRRELFENLGGFDDLFFVYFEDLDLSLRVLKAGYKIHYLSSAVCFHKGGGTSENVKARRLFYALEANILYAVKHFSPSSAAAVVISTVAIEPFARLLHAISQKSFAKAQYTLAAYMMLYRNILKIVKSAIRGRRLYILALQR